MMGLVYLCWVIVFGSFVATGFTLRRLFKMRRNRLAAQAAQSDYIQAT
jgi:hypothetical protein